MREGGGADNEAARRDMAGQRNESCHLRDSSQEETAAKSVTCRDCWTGYGCTCSHFDFNVLTSASSLASRSSRPHPLTTSVKLDPEAVTIMTLLTNEQRHVSTHSISTVRSDLTGRLDDWSRWSAPLSFRDVYGSRTAANMYVSVDGFRKLNSDLRRVFIQKTSWGPGSMENR